MKELLIQALDDAYEVLKIQVPQTKIEIKSISILDVNPIDILKFMKDNQIPNEAYFAGKDNGYDAWDDILLSWETNIPTTEQDKLKFKRRKFTQIAFKHVYDLLLNNGYRRVGYSSGSLNQFVDTTIYNMYMDREFDRIVKYYSLPFTKST